MRVTLGNLGGMRGLSRSVKLPPCAGCCYTCWPYNEEALLHKERGQMETPESINLISVNPDVRSGRPCIAGSGLRITDVVTVRELELLGGEDIDHLRGATADDIQSRDRI